MNLVDSSAWLEYFADGPNAGEFAEPIADIEQLVVPTITLTRGLQARLRGLQQRSIRGDLDSATWHRRFMPWPRCGAGAWWSWAPTLPWLLLN